MSGAERRKHERKPKDAPLILIECGPKKEGEGAVLHDVSLGGLAFETSLPLEPGAEFGFAIYVPSRGWIDGRGRICWTKASGKGRLCGASITVERWDQEKLMRKWIHPSSKGVLRFFFHEGTTSPQE